jgi:hypothetical protein
LFPNEGSERKEKKKPEEVAEKGMEENRQILRF